MNRCPTWKATVRAVAETLGMGHVPVTGRQRGDANLGTAGTMGEGGKPRGGMRRSNGFLAGAAAFPTATELSETCHKIPALLPLWTRCGKPSCRCNDGHPHGPYWVLRWREGSTHRRRYVRAAELAAVRAAVERRRRERAADRMAFADDLALLRRLEALRRELSAALAGEGRGR